MSKIWKLLALILGGERTVEFALGSFDRIKAQLEASVTRLTEEHAKSAAREFEALEAYRRVQWIENQKQIRMYDAKHRAHTAYIRISSLLGEDAAAA